MWEYMQQHEAWAKGVLAAGGGPEAGGPGHVHEDGRGASVDVSLAEALARHERMIARMQHERLIHLLVTLFVAMCLLLTAGYALVNPSLGVFALAGLLLVLTGAYMLHYYRLENGVQRWYKLADDLGRRLGKCAGDGGRE